MQKCSFIDEYVKTDRLTKDPAYNKGLRLIRRFGYSHVSFESDVIYYCMCNPSLPRFYDSEVKV